MTALLAHEPMLGFATEPAQRLREAHGFSERALPQYHANLKQIETIYRDAYSVAEGVRDYIRAKLAFASPPRDPLVAAGHLVDRIETVVAFTATGYEGTAVILHLANLQLHLQRLLHDAARAQPTEKGLLDHAVDAVAAVGHAVKGLALAAKEGALIARDVGLWGIDQIGGALGHPIQWDAASSVGKAYESGKSTGEIFTAGQAKKFGLIDELGFIEDAIDRAIELAKLDKHQTRVSTQWG